MMTRPVVITSRLLPGLVIRDGKEVAEISIEPCRNVPMRSDGKPSWRWTIDLPDGTTHSGDGLAGWGDAGEMLRALLSFLTASAESYRYSMATGRDGEHTDLFPLPVVEWAYGCSDELSMLALDLDETA